MKILFVKPPFPFSITAPPLGALYLSACVKEKLPGVDTRLLHLWRNRNPLETFRKTVAQWSPDIIALTTLTGDAAAIRVISAAAREVLPGVHVSCGGPYTTHSPEEFEVFSNVDSIVRGEGELVIESLLRSVKSGVGEASVEGISFRRSDGLLPVPVRAPGVEDLDALPFPDWGLLDWQEYDSRVSMNGIQAGRRVMPVFTSRGCPYRCSYCHDMFGKQVRFRSAENVVEEMARLNRNYKVDEIQIVDDIFNLDRDRVLEICSLIIADGLEIKMSFPNGVRGDRLDEEVIRALRDAGAYQISYAIETASPRLQKMLNKNVNISKTVEAIKITDRLGMITKSFFMIGFPGETKEEISKTVRLACSLPLTTLAFFTVVPFKGTVLYEEAVRQSGENGEDEMLFDAHSTNYNSAVPYYTQATGINLQLIKVKAYFRFFTPWRLMKFFIKLPLKIRYMKLFAGVLMEAFLPWIKGRDKLWEDAMKEVSEECSDRFSGTPQD